MKDIWSMYYVTKILQNSIVDLIHIKRERKGGYTIYVNLYKHTLTHDCINKKFLEGNEQCLSLGNKTARTVRTFTFLCTSYSTISIADHEHELFIIFKNFDNFLKY